MLERCWSAHSLQSIELVLAAAEPQNSVTAGCHNLIILLKHFLPKDYLSNLKCMYFFFYFSYKKIRMKSKT